MIDIGQGGASINSSIVGVSWTVLLIDPPSRLWTRFGTIVRLSFPSRYAESVATLLFEQRPSLSQLKHEDKTSINVEGEIYRVSTTMANNEVSQVTFFTTTQQPRRRKCDASAKSCHQKLTRQKLTSLRSA